MKKTGVGIIAALACFIGAIAIWVVAYFALPNEVTHRDLAQNPPIATSVGSGSSGGQSGTAVAGSSTGTSSGSSQETFYSLGSAPKTLDLNLESGVSQANQGLNFNGYYNGNLVITVPVNWTIDMNYINQDSMMPHSVGITTWADRQAMSFTPAFSGSIPKNFSMGITKGNPPMTFSVDANKAGKYAIVCGLPGHATGGMWVELDVSASATAPTIKTPSGTSTVTA